MTLARSLETQPRQNDNNIIVKALVRFFGQCNGIVGHEASYQVMLAFELERDFAGRVRREHRVASSGRGGIDLAVLDAAGHPWAVFELKGGAYGDRSSLKDEFPNGLSDDIVKLAAVDVAPPRRWLVAVDTVGEYGRSLAQGEQRFTANQAGTRAVSFAYYGHGDPTCLIAEAGKQSCLTSVPRSTVEGKQLDNCDLFSVAGLTRVLAPSRDSLQQEADVVATLYRGLLVQGFASRQIAAECYFAFAPKKGKPKKVSPSYSQSGALPGYHACLGLGSRGMHERPDLCLFEPEVDGHFNLYRKGNRLKSYDARKLAALTVMAEVKGGATLQQSRDKTLVNKYRADITKLVTWRGLVGREVCQRDAQLPSVDFVMVAVDLRASPLDPRLTDALASEAQRQGVRFAYVHIPDM